MEKTKEINEIWNSMKCNQILESNNNYTPLSEQDREKISLIREKLKEVINEAH